MSRASKDGLRLTWKVHPNSIFSFGPFFDILTATPCKVWCIRINIEGGDGEDGQGMIDKFEGKHI